MKNIGFCTLLVRSGGQDLQILVKFADLGRVWRPKFGDLCKICKFWQDLEVRICRFGQDLHTLGGQEGQDGPKRSEMEPTWDQDDRIWQKNSEKLFSKVRRDSPAGLVKEVYLVKIVNVGNIGQVFNTAAPLRGRRIQMSCGPAPPPCLGWEGKDIGSKLAPSWP